MSAEEMMGEIGGGKRTVIIIAALAVVLAVIVGSWSGSGASTSRRAPPR